MTKEEALTMLEKAPRSQTKKSHTNQSFTELQAYELVRGWIAKLPDGETLSRIMEKRVHQIAKNQVCPRY